MSLEYAILGFLNYHPYSGYDLKKTFDVSVNHFWPADQSQIYRTLARLADKGWVEMEKIPQEDRPDRKVYHITAAGRTALLQWLAGPTIEDHGRSAALIQVFFSGQLSNEQTLARFKEFAKELRTAQDYFDSLYKKIQPYYAEIPFPREHFFWLLTLENGIAQVRANLAWAESVIERIINGQVPENLAETMEGTRK